MVRPRRKKRRTAEPLFARESSVTGHVVCLDLAASSRAERSFARLAKMTRGYRHFFIASLRYEDLLNTWTGDRTRLTWCRGHERRRWQNRVGGKNNECLDAQVATLHLRNATTTRQCMGGAQGPHHATGSAKITRCFATWRGTTTGGRAMRNR